MGGSGGRSGVGGCAAVGPASCEFVLPTTVTVIRGAWKVLPRGAIAKASPGLGKGSCSVLVALAKQAGATQTNVVSLFEDPKPPGCVSAVGGAVPGLGPAGMCCPCSARLLQGSMSWGCCCGSWGAALAPLCARPPRAAALWGLSVLKREPKARVSIPSSYRNGISIP